jgi:hypothetical protein
VQLRRVENPGQRTEVHLDVAGVTMPMKRVIALKHMTTADAMFQGAPRTHAESHYAA